MAAAQAKLLEALDGFIARSGAAAALPRSERLTMHARQADAVERQLTLYRLLRAVAPRAPALTEAQLKEALKPLGRYAAAASSSAPPFLEPGFLRAVCRRAGAGAVQGLLDALCPIPVARGSVAAADGQQAAAEVEAAADALRAAPGAKVGAHAAAAGSASASMMMNGPFDRGTGKPGAQRRGARFVPPPEVMPQMIKYRHCRTPLLVPPGFDGNLVTRSAQPPQCVLERSEVHGYNGLGKHNRSPNLFALPDGRILYCTAGLAILEDPVSGAQSFYDRHDDDIVCVALHPGGSLVATGQGASAGGASASLSVWEVASRREVSRVGRVLDEKVNDGVTTRPFYPGSLCACAFGPDGKLLIGVGKDDQHLVGVWDWRKGELMAKAVGMVARPLGVHQLAVAPAPLAVDAAGRRTLFFTLVGVANAPKFGTLAPVPGTGPTRWQLTFEVGKLGVKEPPKSLSCVAYGGESFAAPSGAAHGLTFVGGSFGRIYAFDAPSNTTALRAVLAHEGPISCLCLAGGAIASGGADGRVHLWAAPAGNAAAGELERVHTYGFEGVDAAYNPAARAPTGGASSNPLSLVEPAKTAKKEKAPPPVSATAPAGNLPTGTNGGIGAIRSLALVPLGAKRTAASNRRVQVPTLYAGSARCSIWRLEPQGGMEISAGHFGKATGVAVHPTDGDVWASCGADRQLLCWRTSMRLPTVRVTLANPACCVAYAADGKLLATGHEDGTVSVLRATDAQSRTGGTRGRAASAPAPPAFSTGGPGAIEVLAFAPRSGAHGGMLACGSHDRMVRVFELVPQNGALRLVPRCTCSGHTATVTHIDWSADGTMLMTNCAAHEILLWSVPAGKRLAQPGRMLATQQWASWTCYLGFPCMGIWPEHSNATDVNACHRSADESLLISADDSGLLKLYNAPCVVEGAPYRVGTGHCSAVACVRFVAGDQAAVSSGGNDRAIMRWSLKHIKAQRAAVPPLPDQPRRQCMLQVPAVG